MKNMPDNLSLASCPSTACATEKKSSTADASPETCSDNQLWPAKDAIFFAFNDSSKSFSQKTWYNKLPGFSLSMLLKNYQYHY